MMNPSLQNQTLAQLHARKSVRAYDLERPITDEIKTTLLEAAITAPTAGCMCLYTILDITDEAIKKELAVLCDHQPFIARAPLVFVFLADWQRWHDSFSIATDGKTRMPAEGDLFLATADAIIAAQNMVVAAESLGLGSCYIGDVIEQQEKIADLLQIPSHAMPVAMLCIGYPTKQQTEQKKPHRFGREFLVHENTYQPLGEEALRAMFQSRGEGRSFDKDVPAMAARKWDTAFMEEMNRSTRAWLKRWTKSGL